MFLFLYLHVNKLILFFKVKVACSNRKTVQAHVLKICVGCQMCSGLGFTLKGLIPAHHIQYVLGGGRFSTGASLANQPFLGQLTSVIHKCTVFVICTCTQQMQTRGRKHAAKSH